MRINLEEACSLLWIYDLGDGTVERSSREAGEHARRRATCAMNERRGERGRRESGQKGKGSRKRKGEEGREVTRPAQACMSVRLYCSFAVAQRLLSQAQKHAEEERHAENTA